MSRLLLIGYGPLPQPGLLALRSPSLRTRQILQGVREAGHEPLLYTLPLPGAEGPYAAGPSLIPDSYDGLDHWRFASHSGEYAVQRLSEEIDRLAPRAIVGVGAYPSYVAAMLPSAAPLWCDLGGPWMAEMQSKCRAEDDDGALAGAWSIQRAVLRRLDKFSAVSRPHLHATLGEMAGLGRLGKRTFEYPFGARIPDAYFPLHFPGREAGPPLRGSVVPEGAFVILWSGAFSARSDAQTLAAALDALMARRGEVHFVSTGAEPPGGEAGAYRRFQELVAASPHRDRYHLLGWLPAERLPGVYREADLGLAVDGKNYETIFGSRVRLCMMAAEGLALASTVGAEIAEWLEDGQALIGAPMGDPQALADAIEPWIGQRERLREMGRRARDLMAREFSVAATTAPLRQWLESPRNAPDNEAKLAIAGKSFANFHALALHSLEERSIAIERWEAKPAEADSADEGQTPWQRLGGLIFGRGGAKRRG